MRHPDWNPHTPPNFHRMAFRQGQPSAQVFHQRSTLGPILDGVFDPGRTRALPQTPSSAPSSAPSSTQFMPPSSALPSAGVVDLPPSSTCPCPDRPLRQLLDDRRSCREFGGRPPKLEELSLLLDGAYGVRRTGSVGATDTPIDGGGGPLGTRPVPSAGASYGFELYVLVRRAEDLAPGIWHYRPQPHRLERIRGLVPWGLVQRIYLDQPWIGECDLVVVCVARLPIAVERYGERSYRYALFEAGHIVQNLQLLATDLGLGSLPTGGFRDLELAELLDLDPELEFPLYGAALGHPAAAPTPT